MARITIVVEDNFVAVDGVARPQPLNLSGCGIPTEVHALQWQGTFGWVEFREGDTLFTPKLPNQEITELPAWANACVAVHAAWTPPPPPEPEVPVEPVTPEV